jgi:hypothetical protein
MTRMPHHLPLLRGGTAAGWCTDGGAAGGWHLEPSSRSPVSRTRCGAPDYNAEFMLGYRRYCYPLRVTDFASRHLLTSEALARTLPLDPRVLPMCSECPVTHVCGMARKRVARPAGLEPATSWFVASHD